MTTKIPTFFFALLFLGNARAQTAADVNKPVSPSERATIGLQALYNLDGAQLPQVLHIQQQKFSALAEIEPLKNADFNKYVQKRTSACMDAESALYGTLDDRQKAIYEREVKERGKKKQITLGSLRKQGMDETEALKKIVDTDLF